MVQGSSNAQARPDLVPDGAISVSARELLEQEVHELFDQRDVRAVDRYWSPDYIELRVAPTATTLALMGQAAPTA